MNHIAYYYKVNQGFPDFVLRNFLDGLIGYYMWGIKNEGKSYTYTKDYAVSNEQAECDIPSVLSNFVGGQAGHSNCIMEFVGQLGEYNTFAESYSFRSN